jgi:hypothetical protein
VRQKDRCQEDCGRVDEPTGERALFVPTEASTEPFSRVTQTLQLSVSLFFCAVAWSANLLAYKLFVLKAETAIATAATSWTSSSVAPACLAPARVISVHGLHPLPSAAAKPTSCLVLESRLPGPIAAPTNSSNFFMGMLTCPSFEIVFSEDSTVIYDSCKR